MTEEEFRSRLEGPTRQAIAEVAGVTPDDITINVSPLEAPPGGAAAAPGGAAAPVPTAGRRKLLQLDPAPTSQVSGDL